MRAALMVALVAATPAWAQLLPEYEPLVEPIGQMMTGCLEQSYDEDSALACEELTTRACLAMGEGGDTTFGLIMCATLLGELWDAELNRLWPALLEGLDATEAERWREEQRAWIELRAAASRFAVAEVAGGSMASYAGGFTAIDMTAARVAGFREVLRSR